MEGHDGPRRDTVLALLNETVRHARETVPFYAQRIPPDIVLNHTEDIATIPVLTRDDLARLSRDILFGGSAPPDILGLTSGSSFSDKRTFIYRLRGFPEQRLYRELYAEARTALHETPLMLRLINANHGGQLIDSERGVFSIPFEQPYHFHVIVDLLHGSFHYEHYSHRIKVLVAPLQALKTLTVKLQEEGVAASAFQVERLVTFAWRLTPPWHRRLEDYWQAPVTNLYGLSEVPGLSATMCPTCGAFHFANTAFVELLDLDEAVPARDALGRLVATAYYPLAETLPILRYDTDDVFLRRGRCPETGRDRFEFLGRRSQLIPTPGHWPGYLSTGLLADALDGFNDIARAVNPRVQSLDIETPVGAPLFDCTVMQRRLHLTVSCRDITPDRRALLHGAIQTAVNERLQAFGTSPPLQAVDVIVTRDPVGLRNRYI